MKRDLLWCVLSLLVGGAFLFAWDQAPALSEAEQAKVELLQLRIAYAQLVAQYDGCKAEVGATYQALGKLRADQASKDLTAEEARVKAAIEQAHPGFRWDPKTGVFTPKPAEK